MDLARIRRILGHLRVSVTVLSGRPDFKMCIMMKTLRPACQNQHNSMDSWVDFAITGSECTPGYGLYGWRGPHLSSCSSSCWLARKSPLSGLYSPLSRLLGNERRFLASAQSYYDGVCVDGNSSILGWSR